MNLIAKIWLKMESEILWESDGSDHEKAIVPSSSSQPQQPSEQLLSLLARECRCTSRVCFQQFEHCAAGVHAERARFRELDPGEKARYLKLCKVPFPQDLRV